MEGRPAIFETDEQLTSAIDDYFNNGIRQRKVVIGKPPNQTIELIPVPTITGLAYHIGFESRQSFYDYEERPEFSYTIKRARLFIEREYEEQLTMGNTTGAIFALKNMGWRDKTEQDIRYPEGIALNFEKAPSFMGGFETKDQQKIENQNGSKQIMTKSGYV